MMFVNLKVFPFLLPKQKNHRFFRIRGFTDSNNYFKKKATGFVHPVAINYWLTNDKQAHYDKEQMHCRKNRLRKRWCSFWSNKDCSCVRFLSFKIDKILANSFADVKVLLEIY